jgi:hypothetical protein
MGVCLCVLHHSLGSQEKHSIQSRNMLYRRTGKSANRSIKLGLAYPRNISSAGIFRGPSEGRLDTTPDAAPASRPPRVTMCRRLREAHPGIKEAGTASARADQLRQRVVARAPPALQLWPQGFPDPAVSNSFLVLGLLYPMTFFFPFKGLTVLIPNLRRKLTEDGTGQDSFSGVLSCFLR